MADIRGGEQLFEPADLPLHIAHQRMQPAQTLRRDGFVQAEEDVDIFGRGDHLFGRGSVEAA